MEKAICSFKVEAGQSRVQLLPATNFRAKDGRPLEVDSWKINRQIALSIINKANALKDDMVIDYEHQTMESAKNGYPAPAAGWFKQLEWIDGEGLFALGVQWTAQAKQLIRNAEYRYISPVLDYNKITGEVTNIAMAALVNFAAIDGMNKMIPLKNKPLGLSEIELELCKKMSLKQEDYIAANTPKTKPKYSGISEVDLNMCLKMGLEPEDWIAANGTS